MGIPKKGLFGLFLKSPSLLLSSKGCVAAVGGMEAAADMPGGIDVVVLLGTNESSCDDVWTGGC